MIALALVVGLAFLAAFLWGVDNERKFQQWKGFADTWEEFTTEREGDKPWYEWRF